MKRLGQYGIETAQLDNGLKIILKKMPCPRVHISILVECGPLYESEDKQGISHFLEHLVGQEGKTRNKNSRLFYKIDRDGGDINATTDFQITSYDLCTHQRFWFRDFKMLLNSIVELNFSPNDFDTEQLRVMAEMKEEFGRDTIVRQRIFPNHPLSWPIRGTRQSVSAITPADIHSWHRKSYFPGRMMIVVVGNISMKMVIRAVKSSRLSAVENKKEIPLPPRQDFDRSAINSVVGYGGNWVDIVYPMPSFGDTQELFLFFLISNYIFDDTSELSLSKEVAFEMGVYDMIYSEFTITPCSSFFRVALEASSRKELSRKKRRFFSWIKKAAEGGIGRDRFRRLYLQRVADIKSLPGADWLELLSDAVCWGVIGNLEVFLDPVYIDKKELDRVMEKYFGGSCLIFRSQ